MAYRSYLAIRAKHYTQQKICPSFAYLGHENDDRSKVKSPKNHNFSPIGFPGSKSDNLLGFGEIFQNRRTSQIPFLALNCSFSARHMSSSSSEIMKVMEQAVDPFFLNSGLQHLIGGIHNFTGLNWWASIVVATILIRGITIPLMIKYPLKDFFKLLGSGPIAADLREKHMLPILQEYNNFPSFDIPFRDKFIRWSVYLSFYISTVNMVAKIPSFTSGGALWFTDLTTMDSYFILPILSALTYLIRVESDMPYCPKDSSSIRRRSPLQVTSVVILSFCGFPKGLYFYWITSNVFMIIFKLALQPSRDKLTLLGYALLPNHTRIYMCSKPTELDWQAADGELPRSLNHSIFLRQPFYYGPPKP